MTRFLANWEVESDIILPADVPFVRYDHPAGIYTVFLRNIPEKRGDLTFLSMQFIFDAPSIQVSKDIGEALAKEFLDHLAFVSNLKVRLRGLRQIFNWEPPANGMRECYYYADSYAHDDAPYEELGKPLLDTIAEMQKHALDSRLRRALKWFANGIATQFRDDQFMNFWLVIELTAQLIKEPSPIPDKCPTCQSPLYCETCGATPLHKPYPKQAIEHLFSKYITDYPDSFNKAANAARNMITHGEEISAVEAKLQLDFSELVDSLGKLAWHAILNQFVPVLAGAERRFLQTNRYVHMNMSGMALMQVGFLANLEDADPRHFPDVHMSMKGFPENQNVNKTGA